MNRFLTIIGLTMAGIALLAHASCANDLSLSNVSLGSRDGNAKSVTVSFDLSWANSWRNKINHDAVWLTVRLNNASASLSAKQLCQVTAAGLDPAGTSIGTGSNIEIYVPPDRRGALIRPSVNGVVRDISASNLQLTINYQSCGFSDNDQIYAGIFGLEMVFVPEGSFYAGDYNSSVASLNKGATDSSPWNMISENALPVSNLASGGYRYVSNGNLGESATGASFSIPAAFPKGYGSFYVMKYELNEGQWVEFLNSLPSAAARAHRDVTDTNHKNSDTVVGRNTIACSGTPLICSTLRPSRPVSFLNWMDLTAFLDWDALRPMTELEFEKMARGPALPFLGEYAWGTTDIHAADAISGNNEDGTESVITSGANARLSAAILSGGDASNGAEYQAGPLRNGIFASAYSTRVTAGSSYYGVMELSGNVVERVVTIGNAAGLDFTGAHGDGILSPIPGYEGNADVSGWPGTDAVSGRGVTGANGSGFRGGSWSDGSSELSISDRSEGALTSTAATASYGGRGVRTYDGN